MLKAGRAACSVTFMGGPILVAIAAFWTFTAQGNTITADIAFPALAYFDLLRFPIIMLPMQVMNFINARVAVKRLQSFMNAEEVPHVPLCASPHPVPPLTAPAAPSWRRARRGDRITLIARL